MTIIDQREGIWMINNGTIDTYYPAFRCPNKEKMHFGIHDDTVNYWGLLDKDDHMFGIMMRPDCWVPNRFIMIYNEEKTIKEWIGVWRGIKCHCCESVFTLKDKKFEEMLDYIKNIVEDEKINLLGYAIKVRETPSAVTEYLTKIKQTFQK
jgi:hypothetical protein